MGAFSSLRGFAGGAPSPGLGIFVIRFIKCRRFMGRQVDTHGLTVEACVRMAAARLIAK